ncbi:hypothetical protein MTP99_018535 [Tenebrio molitor]|nr:hypothetical protein MTP99_018535 [Tenebrio molitor]
MSMGCKYQRFEVDHVWSQSGPVLLLTLPGDHKFPICVILIDPVLPVSVGSASAFMFRQESNSYRHLCRSARTSRSGRIK